MKSLISPFITICFFLATIALSIYCIFLLGGEKYLGLVAILGLLVGKPAAITGLLAALFGIWQEVKGVIQGVVLGICMGVSLITLIVGIVWYRDLPDIVLFADYYNEEGFELYLREDQTFKIQETGMISSASTYGTYTTADDVILLSKEVRLSGGCLLDRQFIRKGNYLHFTCKNGVVDRQSIGPLSIRRAF